MKQPSAIRSAGIITSAYTLAAGLWILLSDRGVAMLVQDPTRVSQLQTWKGWFFVLVTSLLLFEVLKRTLHRRDAALRRERSLRRHLQQALEAGTLRLFVYDTDAETLRLGRDNDDSTESDGEDPMLVHPALPLDAAVHPDDLPSLRRAIELHVKGTGPVFTMEFRLCEESGAFHWVRAVGARLPREPDSTAATIAGSLLDIHDRKQVEERLRATNRALTAITLCHEAIVRSGDEIDLMRTVCRTIVEQGGYRMAWVGLADDAPGKTVRPVAHWGGVTEYLNGPRITWGEDEHDRGPADTAVSTGKPSAVRDILTDPDFIPWRERAGAHGFSSVLALPLLHNDEAFAVLTIYAQEPDAFEPTEVELLTRLANDLAFGLVSIRTRQAAIKAERELRTAEARFRATFEQAAVGMCHLTPEGAFTRVNATLCTMLGLSREALLRRSCHDISHPEDRARGQALLHDLLDGKLPHFVREKRCVRSDGTIIWVQETVSLVRPDADAPAYCIAVIEDFTQRKRMQLQLEQSRHEMSTLADNLPDFVARFDRELHHLFVNRALCQVTGIPKERYLGNTNQELGLPEDLTRQWNERLRHVFASGQENFFQFSFHGHDGEHILHSRIVPEFDIAGQLTSVIAVTRDITDLKRAESELLASQHRLNEAQRIAKLANFERDLVSGEAFWSDEMYRLLGYAPQEVEPSQELFLQHVHPEDQERFQRQFLSALELRTEFASEFRYIRTNRQERHGSITGRIGRDPAGKTLGYSGVFQDITERKRAKDEYSLLATAIEQAGESVTITDPRGVIQYVNPAFERISGYRRIEVQGRTPRLLISGAQDNAWYDALWRTINSGRVWQGRSVNRRKDGSLFEVEATISPVRNSVGAITHYVALMHDVTDRMRMEKQLHQAQKMEAIGTLAGGIAHDFNNILAAIMGFAEIALLETPAELQSVRESLSDILTGSRRGADLVRSILTFSRQSTQEKTALQPEPLVKEALKLLRASLPAGIEIRQRLELGDAVLMSSPSDIHQLMVNLCTNAAQAMLPRGGTLEVSLLRDSPTAEELSRHRNLGPGPHLRLIVRDTGPGITPDITDRIFDPFFTTKAPGEGTGLGLSIVHGVVQGLDGAIEFQSAPDSGTTFQVLLPLVSSPMQQAPEPGEIWKGSQHILLVEDENAVARSLERMLELLGYDVTTCSDGRQALDVFKASPRSFDLLLTDQTMPELSGLALAREVHDIRPDLPIVILSGDPGRIQEDISLDAGVLAVLAKPLEMHTLSLALHQALRSSPLDTDNTEPAP